MKKLISLLIILTVASSCQKQEVTNGLISDQKENPVGLVKGSSRVLNQQKMSQDDISSNGTNNVTSLIISNSPLLQFTPDTIRVPVGSQVQLYSNVSSVYPGGSSIHGEWRSWNIPAGQVTRYGGLVQTYTTGIIRITYTCGVMGTNLPNYQVSTRILVY